MSEIIIEFLEAFAEYSNNIGYSPIVGSIGLMIVALIIGASMNRNLTKEVLKNKKTFLSMSIVAIPALMAYYYATPNPAEQLSLQLANIIVTAILVGIFAFLLTPKVKKKLGF